MIYLFSLLQVQHKVLTLDTSVASALTKHERSEVLSNGKSEESAFI